MIKPITPHLWFDTQAQEAAEFYCSVFPNSRILGTVTLGDTPTGNAGVVSFELMGQPFMAISAGPMFKFNEAVSFQIRCETQEEIDHYWAKLSAVPQAEQCGWLKDKFGLSWQVVPAALDDMLFNGSPEQVARVTQAFLPMKKFDLGALQRAYKG